MVRVRHRPPDGARTPGVGPVHRQGGPGLGQAVALEDPETDAVEEMGQPLPERSATAEGEPEPAAERSPQLSVHERIEYCVLDRRYRPGVAGQVPARPVDGHLGGLLEQGPVALCFGLMLGAVEHLLEDPGIATIIVGSAIGSSSARYAMSVENTPLTPSSTPTSRMILASECASGRKINTVSSA